jgi:hypothetical protein
MRFIASVDFKLYFNNTEVFDKVEIKVLTRRVHGECLKFLFVKPLYDRTKIRQRFKNHTHTYYNPSPNVPYCEG